ncbi:hypothetical protein SK128_005610 [Halocaridina rubra]|uniref:LRRCT domain-containing protein n=1 Tax=Halocaridina rubra TaxID=373956 RepID=A0AAN9AAA9_HALRR
MFSFSKKKDEKTNDNPAFPDCRNSRLSGIGNMSLVITLSLILIVFVAKKQLAVMVMIDKTIENDTFQLLTSLKNLSLAHNAITAMPPMLPKGIQSLNFKNNQIEDIHNIFFEELITLNLCDNGILKIDPKEIKLNGLKELCLGGSDFIVDPTLINDMKFPVLESLELEGRDEAALYISGMAQRNILRMISKSLQYLSMESCILQNLDLFNLQASKLQGLKASNVWLPMPDSPRGRNVKFSLGSVEVFDLSGSSGLAKLFIQTPAQISLPTLQILRLSRCHITSFPESVLRSKTPNITHLDISHNPLHCTCFGLSWIQKYVQGGQIQLMEEENTTCSTPDHLNGIPLLMATLCPLTEAMTMTTTAMTTAMRGNVTSQRDITTIPTTEVINSTPGTSKSSTTMETIDTTIKTDIPTTPKTNISTTIVTTTKNTQTTLDVPSYSTTSPMSPENETELPLTVTLRTSFTISTTENISDVRNLQRSGSGISASNTEPTPGISASDKEPTPGIRANNTEPTPGIGVSNTEPAPALTIDQVNLFHVVSAVLAVLLATLLTTAGIVYCRKKCNKRRRREGNMVSMGQLTDSYEPLI